MANLNFKIGIVKKRIPQRRSGTSLDFAQEDTITGGAALEFNTNDTALSISVTRSEDTTTLSYDLNFVNFTSGLGDLEFNKDYVPPLDIGDTDLDFTDSELGLKDLEFNPDTSGVKFYDGEGYLLIDNVGVSGSAAFSLLGEGSSITDPNTFAGSAAFSLLGEGDITSDNVVFNGQGDNDLRGEGALTTDNPIFNGEGLNTLLANGALTTDNPTFNGEGENALLGEGAFIADTTINGQGVIIVEGVGAFSTEIIINGEASIISEATGQFTTDDVVIAGVGDQAILANGAFITDDNVTAGTGLIAVEGNGALTTDLVSFNGDADVYPAGTGAITTDDVSILGRADQEFNTANGAFNTADIVVSGVGEYDINVNRFVVSVACSVNVKARPSSSKKETRAQDSTSLTGGFDTGKQNSDKLVNDYCAPVDNTVVVVNDFKSILEEANIIDRETCAQGENTSTITDDFCIETVEASTIDIKACADRQSGTYLFNGFCEKDVDNDTQRHAVRLYQNGVNDYFFDNNFVFNQDYYWLSRKFIFSGGSWSLRSSYTSKSLLINKIDAKKQVGDYSNAKNCSKFQYANTPPNGYTPLIDPPLPVPPTTPPSGSTYNIPIQTFYTMQNTITCTLDDDTTAIHISNVSINFDADSHSWSFNAALIDDSQVSLVKPANDGTGKEIRVTINGTTWHFIVEKVSVSKRFASSDIRLNGRGLTALLGLPYERKESFNQGTTATVQQLVDTIMPNDWTVVWNFPTWNVDGGAYSYSNMTRIEAVLDVCKKIGAVLVPTTDAKEITIQPRYTVLPWNFGITAPDIVIPDTAIISYTEKPTTTYQPNGVYVHGEAIGGELALVRRTGTAGDRLAETTFNALMTDAVGLRALGERIIAGGYDQPLATDLTTFMDGSTVDLIGVGTFAQVVIDGFIHYGVVSSLSISASLSKVEQSISIAEDTGNRYIKFKNIVPEQPVLVGNVSSVSNNTSLVALVDGGTQRVIGAGTIGTNVYIKDGEIIGEAPTLGTSTIIIG